MRAPLLFVSITFLASTHLEAQLRVPAIISSGMVLQQNDSANLWGWGTPGERILVTASWNGKN
jgi:sialate O-acetylesterase